MKRFLMIAVLGQFIAGCSNDTNHPDYSYVKILTVRDADSGTPYNKGLGLWSYLYYNPNTDSVILRRGQSQSEDAVVFKTYEGRFENQHYADTIAMLIAFLKHHKNGELSYEQLIRNGEVNYDGPQFYVEYNDSRNSHFKSFIDFKDDTISRFDEFYWRLEQMPWNKKLVPNNRINENEEVVHSLKSLGKYDSIVFTPPYYPLPCEKGIHMEMLYGKWRTIGYNNTGYKYTNGNLIYTTNIIGKDGIWIMERFSNGELKPRYSGKIISISEDHLIKVKSKDGIASFRVLNLTKNCFEYELEGNSNQNWRFDRMK